MLTWHNVCKRFGGKTVADALSLDVAAGETVAVLGASGSGKSTLLAMAAGLVKPDGGRILYDGADITRRQPEDRCFSLMFQDYALLPHLNVWQNVAFGLRMRGAGKTEARRRAEDVLAQVGMLAAAERQVTHLSGGEQQRVALARALAIQPKALLLDEPFSALDAALRGHLQQLTRQLVRQYGCPTVLVTHSAQEALTLADRVALLDNGRWLQQGTPDEILNRPVSAAAARLLGCDNVTEQYYVPQRALQLSGGEAAVRVVSVLQQCNAYDVRVEHEKWGVLRWWLPLHMPKPQAGSLLPLSVDEAQVVYFSEKH